MKIFNIDYVAAEGEQISIAKLVGYNSESEANEAPLGEGAVRLQARAATDLASLGAPVLLALAEFKAKKGQQELDCTPDAIWALLNPPPKERKAKADKSTATEKTNDGGSTTSPADATSTRTGAGAGSKKEKKMATKKAAKKASKKAAPKKTGAKATGPRGEKTLKVKAMLERKSGCTRAQVLEATGWPAVSMQAMAKACGLKLRQEKEKGKPTSYFGS